MWVKTLHTLNDKFAPKCLPPYRYPPLRIPERTVNDADEADLLRRAQAGDSNARRELTERNLRLALHYAIKHRRTLGQCDADVREVIADLCMAVMRAAEKYHPRHGATFSTYAYNWLRAGLADGCSMFHRHSRSRRERLALLNAAARRASQALCREPTRDEIAAEMGLSEEQLDTLLLCIPSIVSFARNSIGDMENRDPLHRPCCLGDQDESFSLAQEGSPPSPEELALASMERRRLWQVISRAGLSPFEERIITDYFVHSRSDREIGETFGCAGESIRQKRNAVLLKLRRAFKRRPLADS